MNADPTPMNAEVERERLDVISHSIIGAAQRVSSTLGFGFLEKVYENALVIELRKSARTVHRQAPIQVRYEGIVVGHYIPDLVVDDSVLVEIKAVVGLDRVHKQQCLNYLRATGHPVCLLLNFGQPRLEVKRLVWNF